MKWILPRWPLWLHLSTGSISEKLLQSASSRFETWPSWQYHRLWQEVLTAKHASDIFTSGLFQRVFELLMREGVWEQQLAKVRRLYKNATEP